AIGSAAALASLPAAAETASKPRNYKVPAGELRNALDALAAQGDIQIVYDPVLVDGKQTHGASGRFTPIEALQRLLAGTGVSWKTINAVTFVLEPSAVF